MRALRRLLITLLVLAALLVAADRGAAYAASRLAERNVAKQGAGHVNIRILGFPFLTQVAHGDLSTVTVSEREITSDGLTIDSLYATGRGIHVPFGQVLHGTVKSVPIDSVDGSAVITYGTLSTGITKALGLSRDLTLTITPAGTGDIVAHVTGPLDLSVSQTVPVPTVSGGRLQLGQFVQRFASFLPSSVSDLVSVALPALPYGLTLGSATAQSDGIHLAVNGRDITVPTSH
jgi:hypothetical protein